LKSAIASGCSSSDQAGKSSQKNKFPLFFLLEKIFQEYEQNSLFLNFAAVVSWANGLCPGIDVGASTSPAATPTDYSVTTAPELSVAAAAATTTGTCGGTCTEYTTVATSTVYNTLSPYNGTNATVTTKKPSISPTPGTGKASSAFGQARIWVTVACMVVMGMVFSEF
jgi:hypothetical protein